MRAKLPLAATLALIAGCGPTPPTIVERAALKGHAREVVSIAIAPDGKTLASRGADAVKVWDLAGGVEARSFPVDGSDFGSVAFSPDGKALASERIGLGAMTRDLATGRVVASYAFPPGNVATPISPANPGWGLAYSPDGKVLAGGGSRGGEDGFIALWDPSGGGVTELGPARRPITTLAYAPDGKTIASGGMDGKIILWDPASRSERLQIPASRSYLAPVVFSPDGRFVASADEKRWVKLWDAGTGREARVMKGHLKAVLSLAFSPDGKAIVSGDSSGTLFVWDVSRAEMLARLESDRGKVWCLAFGPDGKTLASSGEDRVIHLWDVSWPDSAGK